MNVCWCGGWGRKDWQLRQRRACVLLCLEGSGVVQCVLGWVGRVDMEKNTQGGRDGVPWVCCWVCDRAGQDRRDTGKGPGDCEPVSSEHTKGFRGKKG